MPSNAEIFLQLNKNISREKRKKKIWRAFFFVFLLLSFICGTYITCLEYFQPPFGKPAALYQEKERLRILNREMEVSILKLNAGLDSLKQVNDLLLENTPYYTGVFFEVQIGAFSKFDLSSYEEELVNLRIDKETGLCKYTLGKFRDFERAKDFLAEIRKMGLQDAFIVGKIDGQRVDLKLAVKEALNGEKLILND